MNNPKKKSFIPLSRRPEVSGSSFKRAAFSNRGEARELIQRYMQNGDQTLRGLIATIYPGLEEKIPRKASHG